MAVAAGWSGAQAETWQQRLDALEAGAPAKLDLGTPQLAQETQEEPITLAPVVANSTLYVLDSQGRLHAYR